MLIDKLYKNVQLYVLKNNFVVPYSLFRNILSCTSKKKYIIEFDDFTFRFRDEDRGSQEYLHRK